MKNRRFIAGAVCPRCAAMDKIVVDLESDARECVACGFTDGRPGDPAVSQEVPTRVSRGVARRVETKAEPVTLVDKTPSKSK
ncbi:MAG: putative metal-binding protein (TIGR02443 family) [Halioglobus sp.]